MKRIICSIISVLLLYGLCFAEEKSDLIEKKDRVSYSLGFQIGGDLNQQGREIDSDALLQGLDDALSAAVPRLSPEEMQSILWEMKRKINAEQQYRTRAAVEQYHREDGEFLAENANKEGVVVLPSGLQYKIITAGTGKNANANDTVTVHYRGALLNGREFYNTRRGKGNPETFHVGAVVKGMSEALQLMQEGDRWQLFVPVDLAYGQRGPVGERAVIFDVVLISIKPTE